MHITLIGGTGLIGSRLAQRLRLAGHTVVAAAPSTGVNTLTGQGLPEALQGAQVLVDVSNSPDFADQAVLDFFQTSTRQLIRAATAAGVRHYVALSIVGIDRPPGNGYFRAKLAQEALIRASALPHTIVRATQFHEFVGAIADAATRDGVVHATSAGIQTIAADDVALALAGVAQNAPLNGVCEIAGPQPMGMDALMRQALALRGDARRVVTDDAAPYFGAVLQASTLLPGPDAWLAPTTWPAWHERQSGRDNLPQTQATDTGGMMAR
ncbi:MAG: NAD(P)H-binding protein [Hydrogenophaga sp.]|uniref:SDR family oxidoreductase n=1 Tax=Hydrogenophaga sp. TaxID=1904254 RepID=UPI001D7F505A|nr:NAD(P)H-binding protein [Hydrogenophaga sp.]MBX3610489.1 NAD(P)H-binding protein [Hydrogenophaga sp.]